MNQLIRRIRKVRKRVANYDELVPEYTVKLPDEWAARMEADGYKEVVVKEEGNTLVLVPILPSEVAQYRLERRRWLNREAYRKRVMERLSP